MKVKTAKSKMSRPMTSTERRRFFRASFFWEAEVFFFFRLFIGEIIAYLRPFSERRLGCGTRRALDIPAVVRSAGVHRIRGRPGKATRRGKEPRSRAKKA